MTNAHGIEWVVDGHTFARSTGTLGKCESIEDPRELYPVVVPQNIGPRLQRVLDQLHLCTPKEFMPLDTVPGLRPEFAHPYGHSVDSISDPYRILFFLDSARISEAVLAHKVGHIWIEVVEGIEDYRVDAKYPVAFSCSSDPSVCSTGLLGLRGACMRTQRGSWHSDCSVTICLGNSSCSGVDWQQALMHEMMHCCGASHSKKGRGGVQAEPDCLEDCLRGVIGWPTRSQGWPGWPSSFDLELGRGTSPNACAANNTWA